MSRTATTVASAMAVLVLVACRPAMQEASAPIIPRLEGTEYPDLHGVWQALNTADYDLEGQAASPAAALRPGVPNGSPVPAAPVLALGALGGIPAGTGRGGQGRNDPLSAGRASTTR